MPRKSSGKESRVITYRTLPGSSPRYQRVDVAECTAWVQTNLIFDLEVRGPDGTTETRPYTVDAFHEHRGAVEPTLYLTPGGKWVRRAGWQESPSLRPKPPIFVEVTQAFATTWLHANGYAVPGGKAPIEANARIRKRRDPTSEQKYAHHLSRESDMSQAEVAREIERIFQRSFTQSQVSRAVKRVDDWLQATTADPPARRVPRTTAADPSRTEPNPRVSGGGRRVIRKAIGD
jgi:hypothetical protein